MKPNALTNVLTVAPLVALVALVVSSPAHDAPEPIPPHPGRYQLHSSATQTYRLDTSTGKAWRLSHVRDLPVWEIILDDADQLEAALDASPDPR